MIIYKKTEYSGFKDNGIESVRDKLKLQKYSKDIKIKKVINELKLEIFYNNLDYNNSEFFNFQITNFTENEFGFNLFHKALLIDKIYEESARGCTLYFELKALDRDFEQDYELDQAFVFRDFFNNIILKPNQKSQLFRINFYELNKGFDSLNDGRYSLELHFVFKKGNEKGYDGHLVSNKLEMIK